ncbi:hypothetical protein DUNSADRAFT_15942, partial [Dunaliella salina]
ASSGQTTPEDDCTAKQACTDMEGQYVRSLFVTLRRGLIGKPHFHKRVLAALGLHTRHQCVERPNNESIRGMLAK